MIFVFSLRVFYLHILLFLLNVLSMCLERQKNTLSSCVLLSETKQNKAMGKKSIQKKKT